MQTMGGGHEWLDGQSAVKTGLRPPQPNEKTSKQTKIQPGQKKLREIPLRQAARRLD
jgi:hypothetical protein